MLSTNVILLAIVMIGLIYLYCNNNFREGATGAMTYSFSDQEVCASQGGPCSSTTNMSMADAANGLAGPDYGPSTHNIKIPAAGIVTTCAANTSCDQGDSGKWCIPKAVTVGDSLEGVIHGSLCCIGAKEEGDDGMATGAWKGAWTNFGRYASASGMGATLHNEPIYPWKGCLEPAPGPVEGAAGQAGRGSVVGGYAGCPASSVGAWCPPDNPNCSEIFWGPGDFVGAAGGYCCLPYFLTKDAYEKMGGGDLVQARVNGHQSAKKTAGMQAAYPSYTWLPRGRSNPRPNKYDGPTPLGLTRGTAAAYDAGIGPTWSVSQLENPEMPAELLGACRNKCPSAICGPGKSLKNPAPFCYTTGQGVTGEQNVFCSEKWCCEPTCTPNCTGKTCGDNGCGGSCGTCSSGQTCTNGTCKAPAPPVVACPPSCSDGERTGDSNCSDITCSNCCTTPTCPATCSGGQTRSADAKCKSMTDCTNCCANNPCPQTCDSESMRTKDSNCTNTACSNCCTKKPAACSSFTCPDNTVPKPQDPIPIVCEGNPCTLNECCNNKAVCNTITCQSNYYNQDPTKICSGAICNPSECCIQDPTCQGYECPKYYTSHSDSGEIICENGVCNTGTCCVENNNCSNFADCPDFTHPKADGNNIICQNKNCTEEECCGENPYCSTYYCPQTFYKTGKLISNASSAQCSNFPCTDDECCTFSPSGKLPEIRIWPIYKGQV